MKTKSARDSILETLKSHRLPDPGLPDLSPLFTTGTTESLPNLFTDRLRHAGGDVAGAGEEAISQYAGVIGAEPSSIVDLRDRNAFEEAKKKSLRDWASVKLLIIPSALGVAENGGAWIPLASLPHPASYLLAEHLVIVLKPQDLVETLHEAYARVDFSKVDYGIFLAGPSKTADIEQSLVIGAQGAKSLRVVWAS